MSAIIFKKPERKLDSFLVPLRDKNNNKIRIRIANDILLQKIIKVKEQNAHVIQCLIKDSQLQDTMGLYDSDVLEHVVNNCNSWFNSKLSKEKIKEMFLPSLNNNELRMLVSSIIEPTVFLDNNLMGSFCEVLPVIETRTNLSNIRIIIEIEAHGIYIRSQKFGIRWLVKSVRFFQDDIHPIEALFDESTCYELAESYNDDVSELERQIGLEINDLQEKINSLQEYALRARRAIKEIDDTRTDIFNGMDSIKQWFRRLDSLNRLIWNYQRERLMEK